MKAIAGLAMLVVLGMSAVGANAQVGSSTITGTVEDPSGAVIPGANIVLKDVGNQTTRAEMSNKTGFFSFVNLAAGTYQATVSATGFNSVARKNIEVHIGDQINLPALTLTVNGDSATVTVTAQDAVAPTTSGEQSYTLTSEQIDKLNIEARSAIDC